MIHHGRLRRLKMTEKSKRIAVQVKLHPDEMESFNQVKKITRATTNSDAIRTMINDERLLYLAAKKHGNDRRSIMDLLRSMWKLQGRSTALQSLLTINNSSSSVLNDIQSSFDDLDALVQGLLWEASNLSNNLNQVAHVANLAAKEDPADVDTWQWVIDALNKLLSASNNLRKISNDVHDYIKGDIDEHS